MSVGKLFQIHGSKHFIRHFEPIVLLRSALSHLSLIDKCFGFQHSAFFSSCVDLLKQPVVLLPRCQSQAWSSRRAPPFCFPSTVQTLDWLRPVGCWSASTSRSLGSRSLAWWHLTHWTFNFPHIVTFTWSFGPLHFPPCGLAVGMLPYLDY